MAKIFLLGLLSSLFFLSSCGDDDGDPEGATLVMQSEAFILPGTGDSCQAVNSSGDAAINDDISEYRVALNNIQMTWSRTAQDLNLVYFKIEIESPQTGTYVTTIDGEELDYLMGTSNGLAGSATYNTSSGETTDVSMSSSNTTFLSGASKRACSLTFGGLSLSENSGFFTVTANITLIAIARGNDLQQSEIHPDEVPRSVFDEEALRFEKTVKLIFDL